LNINGSYCPLLGSFDLFAGGSWFRENDV